METTNDVQETSENTIDTAVNLAERRKIRTFHFIREEDESGVSGTGIVAEGVQFTNGKVAVSFLSDKVTSVINYDSVEDAALIHGHGGKTRIVFDDEINEQTISTFTVMLQRLLKYAKK